MSSNKCNYVLYSKKHIQTSDIEMKSLYKNSSKQKCKSARNRSGNSGVGETRSRRKKKFRLQLLVTFDSHTFSCCFSVSEVRFLLSIFRFCLLDIMDAISTAIAIALTHFSNGGAYPAEVPTLTQS
jgi:diacylglycerol kinase